MENFSLFDRAFITAVVIAIFYLAIEALSFCTAKMKFDRGIYPQTVHDFPVYQGDTEDFNRAKQKIKAFSERALAEERAEITLSSDEINCLVTKGNPINKYEPGTYKHYEIIDGYIEERFLRWPSLPGVKGCWTRISRVRFAQDANRRPKEIRQRILEAERSKKGTEFDGSINNSSLLRFIFGSTELPAAVLKSTASGTVEHQRTMAIIDTIKEIDIIDGNIRMIVDKH